jgi:hypothetical protein
MLASALFLASSSLFAGPKCESAKLVLEQQKDIINEATKAGQAKWNKKISIPAKVKLLELFIKNDKDAQCEIVIKSIQKDIEEIKKSK